MKKIVVFHSKTGFTERYAKWIAAELGCQTVTDKEFLKKDSDADLIIFGSWVMAGNVCGLDKIKKATGNRKLVVFATGAIPQELTPVVNKIRAAALADRPDMPFYYMTGGIAYDKMGFATRKMLQMMCKSLRKKSDRNEEEQAMMEALRESWEGTDRKNIEPLLEAVKRMTAE